MNFDETIFVERNFGETILACVGQTTFGEININVYIGIGKWNIV